MFYFNQDETEKMLDLSYSTDTVPEYTSQVYNSTSISFLLYTAKKLRTKGTV